MRIYIDDGSTHIKMLWEQHGKTFTHISPNSFKRGWSATFGSRNPFNHMIGKEKYSFDLISPGALTTSNIGWQYSPLNAVKEKRKAGVLAKNATPISDDEMAESGQHQ